MALMMGFPDIDAVRAGRADHDLLVQLTLGEDGRWIFVNFVDLRGKTSARQKKAESCKDSSIPASHY